MFDVYIGGSMTGRKVRDVLLERAEVKAILSAYNLTYYDPAEDEGLEDQDPETIISNAFDKDKMKLFVDKDLAAIDMCRSMLNIVGDLPSEGTTWEMARAVFKNQIPVYVVAPLRLCGSKMTFTNILVTEITSTVPLAIFRLAKYLKGGK